MKKKVKGFTLIELIVVIAIIGILAGVLVPNMLGTLKRSKLRAANADAKLIFNAAQTIAQEYEFKRDSDMQTVTIYSDGTTGSADNTKEAEFCKKVGKIFVDYDKVKWKVYIENYIVKVSISAENDISVYVGKFPDPLTYAECKDADKAYSAYTDADMGYTP